MVFLFQPPGFEGTDHSGQDTAHYSHHLCSHHFRRKTDSSQNHSSIYFCSLSHQYEEAAICLEALISHFQKERFHPICSDNLINAILDSKRQIAARYNIRTSFQLLLPENSAIENSDLSSIFFNLMDNGIEACRASNSPDPFIQITAKPTANFLTIHMLNSKNPPKNSTTKQARPIPGLMVSALLSLKKLHPDTTATASGSIRVFFYILIFFAPENGV